MSRPPHSWSLALGALLLSTACSGGSAERPEFRVGLLGVGTGPMVPVSSLPAREGAHLAVDEINAAGGVTIAGVAHTLVLVERDVESVPSSSAEGARALINLDSVHAIVGPQISAQALAAGAVTDPVGIPLISPMASNPAVTRDRPHVVRLAFVDAFQGDLLARFAFDSLHVRSAGVLHDAANPYGQDIARLFRETFVARGGRVVGTETFTTDDATDFRPQLRRLIARRPDALLLPNYAVHDSLQIRQARGLGFRGRFLGADSWDPQTLGRMPEALGSVVVANWDNRSPRPAARRFVERYRQRFGSLPRTTAAATYDAIHLLALAASRAGSRDGTGIAAALRGFGAYEGAAADYLFGGSGDPRRGAVVLELAPGGDLVRFVGLPTP